MDQGYQLSLKNYAEAAKVAFVATLMGVGLSAIMFPGILGYSTLGLSSMGMRLRFESDLEVNRAAIWEQKVAPWRANLDLVLKLVAFFVAVFSLTFLIEFFIPNWLKFTMSGPQKFYGTDRGQILLSQAMTLGAGFLLAFAYRATGVLLVLCRAAMNGALFLATFIDILAASKNPVSAVGVFLMLPHLTVAAVAYITTGMSGLFLRKAASKYAVTSPEFLRVAKTCALLVLISLATIVLSAEIELIFGRFMDGLKA